MRVLASPSQISGAVNARPYFTLANIGRVEILTRSGQNLGEGLPRGGPFLGEGLPRGGSSSGRVFLGEGLLSRPPRASPNDPCRQSGDDLESAANWRRAGEIRLAEYTQSVSGETLRRYSLWPEATANSLVWPIKSILFLAGIALIWHGWRYPKTVRSSDS